MTFLEEGERWSIDLQNHPQASNYQFLNPAHQGYSIVTWFPTQHSGVNMSHTGSTPCEVNLGCNCPFNRYTLLYQLCSCQMSAKGLVRTLVTIYQYFLYDNGNCKPILVHLAIYKMCHLVSLSTLWLSFRTHYKEYLVDKINRAKQDPVTIYETDKIKLMLSRDGLEVPEKEDADGEEEDDVTYRERLIKVGVRAILKQ